MSHTERVREGTCDPSQASPHLSKLPLIPLAPEEGLLSALDHSSVIRETLREYLELDVETFGAGLSDSIKEEYARHLDEIHKAEEEIMRVQACNMKNLEDEPNYGLLCDLSKKRFDLSEKTAQKFNLIRLADVQLCYDDIMFCKSEDRNHCALKELDAYGPHLKKIIPKDDSCKRALKKQVPNNDEAVAVAVKKKRNKREEKKEDECVPRHCKGFEDLGVSPLHNKWDDVIGDQFIAWTPGVIEFTLQKVGKTFLRRVAITNAANRMVKFEIRLDRKGSEDFVLLFPMAMRHHFSLAPGMHMNFGVKFKCTNLDDHKTSLEIDLIEGQHYQIPVITKRLPPTLISEKFFFPSKYSLLEFKKSSAITIDCGTRFLGTDVIITSVLYNVGSEASYFISPEANWELNRTPVVTENISHLPPFTVKPILFYLKAGNNVELSVTYKPTCEGLHTEKLMVLCDNFALRSIDLIGEAVIFDPEHFCINAEPKSFDVDEEDFYDAIQCVDFGVVKTNANSTKMIRIKSECPVEVEFHWELQQVPNWPEGLDIKSHQLSFSPNVGVLCAFSAEEVEVTCLTSNMVAGVYKALLCCVVKNIPKVCLKYDNMAGQRPQSEDKVAIELMFLELRVNVMDVELVLEPPLIVFRNERQRYESFEVKADIDCLVCPEDSPLLGTVFNSLRILKVCQQSAIYGDPADVNCFWPFEHIHFNFDLSVGTGDNLSVLVMNSKRDVQHSQNLDIYTIRVKNQSVWEVETQWDIPKDDAILDYTVSPLHATIPPKGEIRCYLKITAKELGKVRQLLALTCPYEGTCFHLMVDGEVENVDQPKNVYLCHDLGPQMSKTSLNFDIPLEFSNLIEDYSLDCTEIEPLPNETMKKSEDLDYKFLGSSNYPDQPFGFLWQIKNNVPYRATLEAQEGTDLRLTTTKMEAAKTEFYVDTVGIVEETDVALDKEEIILGRDFYQRVPIKIKVTMINRNHLCLNFEWQPPEGPDARHVVVEYEPKTGRLEGLARQEVAITLTTDRPGSLEGLLLNCTMENDSKLLFLNCRGYAQDVVVQISYLCKKDPINLTWPRVPSKLLYVSEDFDMKDERCCICFISKFDDVLVPKSWGETTCPEQRTLAFTDSTLLQPYDNWPVISGFYYADKIQDDSTRREFYHNWQSEDLKRRMITVPIEEKSEVIKAFSQHALVFHIKTYQPNNSQRIKVENVTPIHTRYDAEIQEFVACDVDTAYKDEGNCHLRNESRKSLIKKLGGPDKDLIDDLCGKIQPNSGLVLLMKNGSGQLKPHEKTEIEVTAFSNCWGVYFDHIVIRVPELPPAVIPILVVVDGPPVWFTMSPPVKFEMPKEDPVIRFHEVLSRSTAQQTVFVYNDSFLPLKLAWTTFVRRPTSKEDACLCLPDEIPAISVNFEIHPTRDECFGQLEITEGYGNVDSVFYDVEPRVMYIKPKQKLPLVVRVSTHRLWFDLHHFVNTLRGVAHANIYMDENGDHEGGPIDGGFSVYRPDGPKVDPLILRMETKVEISPMRTLNEESTIFLYTIKTHDVVKNKDRIYKEKRSYMFQNTAATVAEVKFDTTGHLHIREALVNGDAHKNRGDGIKAVVRPGDVVELKTTLTVTEGDLAGLLSSMKHTKRHYPYLEDHPLTSLVISHREAIQQAIPIHLVISETKIELSVTSLDFGDVFLYDPKVLPVTIKCLKGDDVFSCKLVSGYKGILKVTPENGRITANSHVTVNVTFTPKECLNYYGMLVIVPSIEALSKRVLLFGRGSWNYKYHQAYKP